MTAAVRPEKCQTCGFSSRHTAQKPGEVLEYQACCHAWMCAACREVRGCTGESDLPDSPLVKKRPAGGQAPANDGIYSGIDERTYHGDRGSLSSSGARTLLNETPAEFIAKVNEPPNPKPQYDFGHGAHKMVLGEGSKLVRVDADDWRTKEAQERRKKAWAAGHVPLLKKDIDIAQRMAGKVFENRTAARLLERGQAELSGYWHDDATGVRLRFRPDFLPEIGGGRQIIVDYKTAVSADPRHFERKLIDFGYHQQAAWYIDGLRETTGCEDAAFLFIVQQKTAPFLVSLCQLQPEAIELGRRQNRLAIDLYARCTADNSWPGYGDDIYQCGLPAWAAKQIEDQLTA